MKTIKNIRKNDSKFINIYSCDSTRNSERLDFNKTMEVEDKFLKTTEFKNISKIKFIELMETKEEEEDDEEPEEE